MKTFVRFTLFLLLSSACTWHLGLRAADKKPKEQNKKEQEPTQDVVVNDELVNADLKDRMLTQSYCKTYTFKMEQDKTYHFEMASTAFPALLRLEGGDGNQVGAGASQHGCATVFHRSPKTQDHTIVATTQNGGAVGKFTLIVREVKEWDGKPIELKNDKGNGSHSGLLLNTDPMKNGKRHRLFEFNMEQGKTYQIDMTSKAFDSYLFLESPDGKQLAANDDGGGYPSARIVHRATETGKHRIITTYFGGGAGSFNLTVQQK